MRLASHGTRLPWHSLVLNGTFATVCGLIAVMGVPPRSARAFQTATALSSGQSAGERALNDIERGNLLLSHGEAAEAEVPFRQAVALAPKLALAHHGLGLALWIEGKQDEAIRELTAASELDPSDVSLHLDLAKAAWSSANQSQISGPSGNLNSQIQAEAYRTLAIQQFKAALKLKPGDVTVKVDLARLLLDDRKPQQAIAEAKDVLKVNPADVDALETLARAFLAENNSVEALAELNRAIQQNPQNGALYAALGQLRQSQGDVQGAIDAFQHAVQLSPHDAPAYSELGELLLHQHQFAAAHDVLQRALALDPDNWELVLWLGEADDKAGRRSEAMSLYQKALRLHPDFPDAREQLALELLREGQTASAAAQALLIAAGHPQAPQYHRIMALVEWKNRNYGLSLGDCALALAADPHSARMLSIQALDLWQQGHRRQATQTFVDASRFQQNIGSSQVFCRLVLCGPGDVSVVDTFLRKNRGALIVPGDF